MNAFGFVLDIVEKARSFGYLEISNGARLFGNVPHVGKQAYLHEVYPPLDTVDLLKLDSEMGFKVPENYRYFLSNNANGIKLFSDRISLVGLRKNYSRDFDDSRKPYHLRTKNIIERLKNVQPEFFLLGVIHGTVL